MVVGIVVPASKLIEYKIKIVPEIVLTYNGTSRVYYENGLIDTGCPITLIDTKIAKQFGITVPLNDKIYIGTIEVSYCNEPIKFSSMSIVSKFGRVWTVNDFDVRVANLHDADLYLIIVGDDFVQRSGIIPEKEFLTRTKLAVVKR